MKRLFNLNRSLRRAFLTKVVSFFLLITATSVSFASLILDNHQSCQKIVGRSEPFVLKLKSGTEMTDAIFRCVKDAKFSRASIMGVGDLKDPVLTYYRVQDKNFLNKNFTGIYEMASMTGEIVPNAENLHERVNIHVTLADSNYQTIGGHLFSGTVGAIAAITIIPIND